MSIYWLNDDALTFLSRDYLLEGDTPEGRMRTIAETAEKILGIPGYADKFESYLHKGYYSLSSPVWTNFGTKRGFPISCNGSYISDSMDDILTKHGEMGMMTKYGAGTSAYFGDVRARGTPISSGGSSFGSVHFMKMFDTMIDIVSQSTVRRGSMGVYLPIDHGDLEEFLTIKSAGSPIQRLNIGLCISDEWMESMIAGDKKKRHIWSLVIKKKFEGGYPYLFFTDTVNRNAPQVYKDKGLKIHASNLCFSGDTIVAVADGRNGVSIAELAKSQGRFPVFSARPALNFGRRVGIKGSPGKSRLIDDYWVPQIKWAKAFETGVQALYKITLDDGSSFRCTADHQIALKSGGYKRAIDLEPGDSLSPFNSYTPSKDSGESRYRFINSLTSRKQHVELWEFHHGEKPKGYHIDHVISGGGDHIGNLQLLTEKEHWDKTSKEREGINNPIHRIRNKDQWRKRTSLSSTLENNGRWWGISNEELVEHGKRAVAEFGSLSSGYSKYTEKYGIPLPQTFSKNRFGGSWKVYQSLVEGNHKVAKVEATGEVETVYDLTVEDNHNFYIITSGDDKFENSSGVLVHNCTEIALSSSPDESFVCCLSSMNLVHWENWKDTDAVETMTYFLDAVMTEYIEKVEKVPKMRAAYNFAVRQRALGLGTLGWHSFLQSKMIPFESMEAKLLNTRIHKFIQERSHAASKEMAIQFGEPDLLKGYGRRNVTTMAIAPTASSSFILGQVSPGVEPLESVYFTNDLQKGGFPYKNPYFEKLLEELGRNTPEVWNGILLKGGSVEHLKFLTREQKDVFKSFQEISQKEIIIQAAARQLYVDQAQSINLKISKSTPPKEVSNLYIEAWKLGLKSLYYQRGTNAAQELSRSILSCASCEA